MMQIFYSIFKTRFIVLFSLVFAAAFADSAAFELGGKAGWGLLQYTENIQISPGKYGQAGIQLRSSIPKITQKTDMYISFDTPNIIEESGSYTVTASNTRFAGDNQSKFGTGAGVCSPHTKVAGLVLTPKQNAFFSGGGSVGSFTIEFWIAPAVSENGSVILQWQSAYFQDQHLVDQYIIAQILQNKLEWNFFNIWQGKQQDGIFINLKGSSTLIPSQWSHHLVSYDEDTGLLEYRMNGHTESIIYITENGRESDAVLPSRLGHEANVFIGLHYTGMIDELKVTRQFTEPYSAEEQAGLFDRYNAQGGRFESLIFDSGGSLSEAKRMHITVDKPYQTEAVFFIRSGENRYSWTKNSPAWKPVRNGEAITGVKGRFFQIAGNLYPDADGQKTPLLHSIQLEYDKDAEPLPPARLFAKANNGSVTLSWTASVDFDVKGYMIYFGNRKGHYFAEGSPINAGKVLSYTIPNLENGKMYFFAVAAYDDEEGKRMGSFSREIWIRPQEE